MGFILAAIPLFFILIAIELVADKIRATNYYQFNDAINSLQLGIFSRITGIIKALLPFSIYLYIYDNYRLFTLPDDHSLTWLFAFIVYDLAYYWVHRLSHRINIMWGSHVVHHSSEEYNLTTALRQTSTPAVFSWLILIPLAFSGISPLMLLSCGALNLIYQFWVHTRHINKLPKLFEYIFVTPSHHRVHHALNRDYIDKNFAGVFILWDKLFNTFQSEKADLKIVYGVSHQLKSWNPIWANVQVYLTLWQDSLATKKWADKLRVWLKPPGWRPEDILKSKPRAFVTTKTMEKYDVVLSLPEKIYILIQHALIILMTFWFLLSLPSISIEIAIFVASFATFSLFTISALQEQKHYALYLEIPRVIATCALVLYFLPSSWYLLGSVLSILYLLISIAIVVTNYKVYFPAVQQRHMIAPKTDG